MLRRVVVFGTGDSGRLGLGLPLASIFFPRVLAGPWEGDVRAVAAGGAHSLVCAADGSVYSCGLNDWGQLGHTPRSPQVPTPTEVLLPEPATAVAAGHSHSLALTEDGRVWAWGDGTRGALGLGRDCPPVSPPRLVKHLQGECAGTRVQGIACGQHHSMALSASGEVFTWGADAQGCLGHGGGWFSGGGTEWRPRVLRTLSTHDVRSVSAGYAHSGAVTAGGEAFLWGDPDFVPGVSRARVSKVDTPRLVPLRHAAELACGGSLTLGRDGAGHLYSWGPGLPGLGRSGASGPSRPLPGIHAMRMASGWQHCAAIDHRGHLWTWGWGGSQGTAYSWQEEGAADGGQLGHGPDCGDRERPWPVEFVFDGGRRLSQHAWKAEAVSCGFNHTMAIVAF